MEEQVKAKDEGITEKEIKVIKEKPEIVRDTVEKKKSLVLIGIKEENTPIRSPREKRDKEACHNVDKPRIHQHRQLDTSDPDHVCKVGN